MENGNPFKIFKSYRTTLRDEDIEMAYMNKKYLIKPFNIFNAWFYSCLILLCINILRLILIYFKLLTYSNEIYHLCVDVIMMMSGKALHVAGRKLPKSHNFIGCLGIIIGALYIIEAYLYVYPPIYVFIGYIIFSHITNFII